jgi:hypothetical protein
MKASPVELASRAGPHLARLRARGSAREIARALRREAVLRGGARRTELALARAARSRAPVVVGPFLGEVGFEVLYWIPMVRRLLARHGIARERVTAVSRGGAEDWYSDLAAGYVDALDLIPPQELAAGLNERRREAGDEKQLWMADIDRDIIERVRPRFSDGPPVVVHPSLMYVRLRYFWAGERPLSFVGRRMAYRRIAPVPEPTPGLDLSRDYVAVKPYASSCFPDSEDNRRFVRDLLARLSRSVDVVLLTQDQPLDGHAEYPVEVGERVHLAGRFMRPRDNLAVQTRIVAGARALVCTYGGFSYLGSLLGVPVHAFYSAPNFNRTHAEVLRLARSELGDPPFELLDVRGGASLDADGLGC